MGDRRPRAPRGHAETVPGGGRGQCPRGESPRGDCPRGHCPRGDYLLEAARQLRLALERDVSEDYEEAFAHYQNGVDVLLRGVQADPNKERGEAVKRKIAQYLRRAEEIFTCHLQRGLGDGSPAGRGYSSLHLRPIRTLSAAVENLRRCKVVGVIDKVQIVQDPATGGTFILKSLPKSHVETRERQTIIPHGVPFMVKLLCYYASEDSIFLHLEHVQGETLWSHLRAKYRAQQGPPHGSGSLHSKATPAPRPRSREDAEGSTPGSSHGPMDPAASTKDPGRYAHPQDSVTAGDAGGCVSARAAPQHHPRPLGGEKLPPLPAPIPKTGRGEPLLPSSLGRRQLEPALQEPSLTRGRSAASWGLRRAPGSWGHGRRAWAVKEEQVRLWAAEILLALEGLHQQGVLCRDLNPRNLLLDTAGHVRLTFFGQWTEVAPQCCSQALEELYSAPEVGGIAEPTEAADCWSFGSLLYELLTGVPLSQSHPSGIHPHTQLQLPEGLSLAAASLLTQLLQHNPKRRLGAGGMAKLKSHSFFSTVPWNKLVG
ncbi:ribosomal protein S6 kinase-like 1 [Aythya fuligula]|uniref:Ribosomal protein S6 kinase-like 1 n=1 Tax=Aythya fuligula TaxID=219594 RepID=A0A6J3D0A2_AYTFU|nr:ribosomal protein S6 kinase-like 1 [Aythya fuligula]